ncbi:MAG: synthase subunit [Evtepia sp.]|jgi:F-type H+-transporting ATPase subunit b|nr:synthase subunit [Evtepia sp.]
MLEFNITTMIWTVINLIVLFLLLKKILFKPVITMIESRQQEIEHNIAAAVDQRTKAESMLDEYGTKLSNAGQEASQLVAQAKTRAEQEYQTIIETARSDARRLINETESQLEAERIEMLTGVRKEVATLALLAAAKVSSRELSYDDNQSLLESFLAEAGERT